MRLRLTLTFVLAVGLALVAYGQAPPDSQFVPVNLGESLVTLPGEPGDQAGVRWLVPIRKSCATRWSRPRRFGQPTQWWICGRHLFQCRRCSPWLHRAKRYSPTRAAVGGAV